MLRPGERVIVEQGIYRERVAPARGGDGPEAIITYEAAAGQKVVIRGSEQFTGRWTPSVAPDGENVKGLWTAEIPKSVTEGVNPFALRNVPVEKFLLSTPAAIERKVKMREKPPYSLCASRKMQ
jgi:hypothetical protein